MTDRCDECGLWKIKNENICPECGNIIDVSITGLCLSCECRMCNYAVATTVNKLCFCDNSKYPKSFYSKLTGCPYAQR